MAIRDVYVLREAVTDFENGKHFYEEKGLGLGSYFWDSLVSDLESLIIHGGIHRKTLGIS